MRKDITICTLKEPLNAVIIVPVNAAQEQILSLSDSTAEDRDIKSSNWAKIPLRLSLAVKLHAELFCTELCGVSDHWWCYVMSFGWTELEHMTHFSRLNLTEECESPT